MGGCVCAGDEYIVAVIPPTEAFGLLGLVPDNLYIMEMGCTVNQSDGCFQYLDRK